MNVSSSGVIHTLHAAFNLDKFCIKAIALHSYRWKKSMASKYKRKQPYRRYFIGFENLWFERLIGVCIYFP